MPFHTGVHKDARDGRWTCTGERVDWVFYVFAAIAGAMNTVQAGANAQLRKSLDQPVLAGLTVYVTGFLALLLALPFSHLGSYQWPKASQVPWWAWLGGLLSIVSTLSGLLLARKLGSAAFTGITVTFSLISSVLLDHFGLIGFEVHRASPARLAGFLLLLGGLVLVARF